MYELSPHLTDDELQLLNAVIHFSREHDSDVGAPTLLNRYLPGWSLQRLRETARELADRGLIRASDLETSDTFRLGPTGRGTLLLKGRTIPDHQPVAVVGIDETIVAQLAESIAALHEGQRELVDACRTIAEELKEGRSPNWAERVQALVGLLQAVQTAGPLVRAVLIPMLQSLAM